MRKAIVIRHVHCENLGNLSGVLYEKGFSIQYRDAGMHDLNSIHPLEPDLLVILGGPISANDDTLYPFLSHELRILEQRLAADLPTLGICLGAQLMARALGSRVYPGPLKEIGWNQLNLTATSRDSPLMALGDAPVLHWHGETFDLPSGATHLASTDLFTNQAFSWGKNGLGLQFHAEVTPAGLERWFIAHAAEISATSSISVTQLRDETSRYAGQLQPLAKALWNDWLDQTGDVKCDVSNDYSVSTSRF